MSDDDFEMRKMEFALNLGLIMGFLKNPEMVTHLKNMEVTQGELDAAFRSLVDIAECFYRKKGPPPCPPSQTN